MTDRNQHMSPFWNIVPVSSFSHPGSGGSGSVQHQMHPSTIHTPALLHPHGPGMGGPPTGGIPPNSLLHLNRVGGFAPATIQMTHPNSVVLGQPLNQPPSGLHGMSLAFNPYLPPASTGVWIQNPQMHHFPPQGSLQGPMYPPGALFSPNFIKPQKRDAAEASVGNPPVKRRRKNAKAANEVEQNPDPPEPSSSTSSLPATKPSATRKPRTLIGIIPSEHPVYAAPRKPRSNIRPYSISTDVPVELVELPVDQLYEEVYEEISEQQRKIESEADQAFNQASAGNLSFGEGAFSIKLEAPQETVASSSDPNADAQQPFGSMTTQRFKCRICTHTFPKKHTVIAHIKTHLGRKPFQCRTEGCEMAFVREHDRKRHEITHTGIRPYACECGKPFSRPDALRRHTQYGRCSARVGDPIRDPKHENDEDSSRSVTMEAAGDVDADVKLESTHADDAAGPSNPICVEPAFLTFPTQPPPPPPVVASETPPPSLPPADPPKRKRGRPPKPKPPVDPNAEPPQDVVQPPPGPGRGKYPRRGRGRGSGSGRGRGRPRGKAKKVKLDADDAEDEDEDGSDNDPDYRRPARMPAGFVRDGRDTRRRELLATPSFSADVSPGTPTIVIETVPLIDPDNPVLDSDFNSDVDIFQDAGYELEEDPDHPGEEPKSSFMPIVPGYAKEVKRRLELGLALEDSPERSVGSGLGAEAEKDASDDQEQELAFDGFSFGLLNTPGALVKRRRPFSALPRRSLEDVKGKGRQREEDTEADDEESVSYQFKRRSSLSPEPPYVSLPPTTPSSPRLAPPSRRDELYSTGVGEFDGGSDGVNKLLSGLLKGVDLEAGAEGGEQSVTSILDLSPVLAVSRFALRPVVSTTSDAEGYDSGFDSDDDAPSDLQSSASVGSTLPVHSSANSPPARPLPSTSTPTPLESTIAVS